MRDNYNEPPLTYALDSYDKMVHIGSVKRGLDCCCRCPKCNEYLEAKLGYGGHQAHFSHQKDSDCHGSYMSALHKLAEQIIEKEKAVMVPTYKEIEKQKLEFEKVEVEQRVERKDLQPDIVGVTSDGLRWFIEIRNTHEVDEAKRAKLIDSNITCLEIDVREQTLENLKSFLLESTESREWINNPCYDAKIVDIKHKKIEKVTEFLRRIPQIKLPPHPNGGYESKKILIKEFSILDNTIDGLYSTVKVLSSENQTYIFYIGACNDLEYIYNSKNAIEYDELYILTDDLSFNLDIQSVSSAIQWCSMTHEGKNSISENQLQDKDPTYKGKRSLEECYNEFKSTNIFISGNDNQEDIFKMEKTRHSLILLIGGNVLLTPYKILRLYEDKSVVYYKEIGSSIDNRQAKEIFQQHLNKTKLEEEQNLLFSLNCSQSIF